MIVTSQIREFFNLGKLGENLTKLIPDAKLAMLDVFPSCYDF